MSPEHAHDDEDWGSPPITGDFLAVDPNDDSRDAELGAGAILCVAEVDQDCAPGGGA